MSNFVALHNHTYYSVRDGISSPIKLCQKAQEAGCTAVAITDHGTISGWVAFQKAADEVGIKPIFGIEMYEAPIGAKHSSHIVLLAANQKGLTNIIKIFNYAATTTNSMGYPRVDIDSLPQSYGEGIICLTGCANTPLLRALFAHPRDQYKGNNQDAMANDLYSDWEDRALQYLYKLDNIFDKVYIEVQNHGLAIQYFITPLLRTLSERTGFKCVWTQDSHFINPEDVSIQETIFKADPVMKNLSPLKEAWFKLPNDVEYITNEEVNTTLEIAELCNARVEKRDPILPEIDVDIRQITNQQLQYKQLPQEYKDRLDYELDIIYKYNLQGYFALIYDICNFAHKNNITLGPGRGSASSSITSYLLGITNVDPLKYDLYFERFINPGRYTKDRISLPDIDIDVASADRQKIYDYLANKYGEANVCHISNFNFIHIKDAIRKYCRAHNLNEYLNMALSITDQYSSLREFRESKDYQYTDEIVRTIVENAGSLCGMVDSVSTHACGLIIANDITSKFPVRIDKNKNYRVIDFDKDDIEYLGGVKIDLLSLSQLDKINYMQEIYQVTFDDTLNIIPDMPEVQDYPSDIPQPLQVLLEYFKTNKGLDIQFSPSYPLGDVQKYNSPYMVKDNVLKFIISGKKKLRCSVIKNNGYGIILKSNYKPFIASWVPERIFYVSTTDNIIYNIFILKPEDVRNLSNKYYDDQVYVNDKLYLNIPDNKLLLEGIKCYQIVNGVVNES